MDNDGYEMEEIPALEEGRLKTNGGALSGTSDGDHGALAPPVVEGDRAEETARYDEIRGIVETGNGLHLESVLAEWQEKGWLRDWRDEENLTLYSPAITDSFLDIINVLLKYDIPLGDALIRAIHVDFEDAIKAICQYLSANEDICREVLSSHSDNDDFHPAITPLVLAAQRNSYNTTMLLLDLGAELVEPSISLGGDVTLTQAISTLHVYHALSRPAYILATQTDVFGYAFAMTAKLRALSRAWTDFGAELEEFARRIEVFSGEMLGMSASSGEILALFGYHNTDKYRDNMGRQHQLSKMFEGIMYQQKEFIAHPHSQKAIIGQFYRNLQSWNGQGFLHQILLMFLVLLGYPFICLLYIFCPVAKVVRFVRNPYIMFLMNTGSGFTFLALMIGLTVVDQDKHHDTARVLYTLLLVWVLGLLWSQAKTLAKHGLKEYLSHSLNIVEAVIVALYLTVFFLQWNGPVNVLSDALLNRRGRQIDRSKLTELEDHVSAVLSGFHGRLNDTLVRGVGGVLTGVLAKCQPVSDPAEGGRLSLTPFQQAVVDYDQYEPVIVAQALLAVTVVVSFIRLTNLLLVSETVGPLRISLGSMVEDILKFCGIFVVIWLAFAIGLHSNYYSAGEAASRECYEGGGSWADCQSVTGFSTLTDAIAKLYWSLFGMIELDVLVLDRHYSTAELVGTGLFIVYHIVAVLVLLNALIGMLSNTYNLTEEHADTEWKFHRAAVWASYLRPVGTLPPPFNLVPSVKSVFRFFRYIVGIWLKCARRKQVNQKAKYSKEELTGYMRALKLTRDRYAQDHLSSTSTNSEGVRPRDIQSLRNDVTSFRFFAQDRLETLSKSLNLSNQKSSELRQKLEDLDPLKGLSTDVVQETAALSEDTDEVSKEVDGLSEEQQLEIVDRDQEARALRDQIAALQAELQQLLVRHSSELAETDRLNNKLEQLRLEKAELIDTIGRLLEKMDKLQQQVDRLKRQIPTPIEEVPDEEPSQESIGFFRRIANVVEKKFSDLGEGLTADEQADNNLPTDIGESPQAGSEYQDPTPLEREQQSRAESQAQVESAGSPETPKKELEVQKEPSEQQTASPARQVDSAARHVSLEPTDAEAPRQQPDIIGDPILETEEEQQSRREESPGKSTGEDPEQNLEAEETPLEAEARQTGMLLEETEQLQLQVDRPTLQMPIEEVPDEEPSQERIGFFRRIANVVEKKFSDLGEGLTASGKYDNNLPTDESPTPLEREQQSRAESQAQVESAGSPETPRKELEVQKEPSEQQTASPARQVDSEARHVSLEPTDVETPHQQPEMIGDPILETEEEQRSRREESPEKSTGQDPEQSLEAEEADARAQQAEIQTQQAEVGHDPAGVDAEVEEAVLSAEQRQYVTADELRSSPFEDIDLPPSTDSPLEPVH